MKARKLWMTIAVMLLCCLTAEAIPVKPGQWSTVTLADGTKVRVEARGDEYSSWYRDAQGQCYMRQGDTYVKTDMQAIYAQRRTIMERFARASRRTLATSTADGLGYLGLYSQGSQYSVGEWEIPVLMVEFSDMKFDAAHTQALFQDYLTKEGFQYNHPITGKTYGVGSVRDYFVAQSQGMFKPNFKVLGKVTLEKSFRYYGANITVDGALIRDVNCKELPVDAMRAAKAQLGTDFKKYDIKALDKYHQDGIPLIVMIYAGAAESEHDSDKDRQPDLIWPHELDMYKDADTGKDWRNIQLTEDESVTLNSYFVGNELTDYETASKTTVTGLAGIGVTVHELGHALGLPDWYATDKDPETEQEPVSGDDAFSNWSVMDAGPYVGGNSFWTPMGYTAYERSYMGWWQIGSVSVSTHYKLYPPYTLYPGTEATTKIAGDCLVFRRDENPESAGNKEYFILESRQPSTWYPTDLGTGLMLSRFAFDDTEWMINHPNNTYSKRRAIMITADGKKLDFSAYNSNLYGNGVNTISGLKFVSGADWDVTISNITKNSDGSIEFDIHVPTTGIETVQGSMSNEDCYYDLQGRRTENPSKGIYIKNGKKVVIK